MTINVTPSGAPCGATITGIDLSRDLSDDQVAEIRAHWLEHKVVAFPEVGGLQHRYSRAAA